MSGICVIKEHLKRRTAHVFKCFPPVYVLTYGAETLTFTKALLQRVQVMQRRMELLMQGNTLKDIVPYEEIRRKKVYETRSKQ